MTEVNSSKQGVICGPCNNGQHDQCYGKPPATAVMCDCRDAGHNLSHALSSNQSVHAWVGTSITDDTCKTCGKPWLDPAHKEQPSSKEDVTHLARMRSLRWPYVSDAEYLERLKSKSVITESGCWELRGFGRASKRMEHKGKKYIDFCYRNKRMTGHRAAWTAANGQIPKGMMVMHKCDNPPCCNPDHLELGTHKQNMEDMNRKGRNGYSSKTHCKRGHEFTPENTEQRITKKGTLRGRSCKTCSRIKQRIKAGWPKDLAETAGITPKGHRPVNAKFKRQKSGDSHVG